MRLSKNNQKFSNLGRLIKRGLEWLFGCSGKQDSVLKILPYTEDNLALSLSNNYTPKSVITDKFHFLYFKDYLGAAGLNAKTIVIEDDYVSKDFLHDYASYYAFCFERYQNFCKRVHFFENSFEEKEFKKIITTHGDESNNFFNHYLGFIVIKPIPVTVVGYTVLKTYPSDQAFNNRYFWGVRDYSVHVYGHEVKFKSLAFQEQDTVLAACATTAIWSMLNKAAIDFHTILKSPSQITKDADNVSPDGSRLFPNKGLNLLQICQSIVNSGLVSEIKQPDYPVLDRSGKEVARFVSNQYLKKILNAYSPIGIPIILVIDVPNNGLRGLHAITVSGFKQNAPKLIPPKPEISWLADNVEKFYAHDDQWGPFARITFNNYFELVTTWTKFDKANEPTYVTNIVVPIYPKIRISYEDIEVIVLGIDRVLTFFFDNNILGDLVWDIRIDYSENFKKYIRTSANIDEDEKFALLVKSQPKYLWIATCYIGDFIIMELTFDATDVSHGMIGEDIILYLPDDITSPLRDFLENNKTLFQSLFRHKSSLNYYDFLLNKIN